MPSHRAFKEFLMVTTAHVPIMIRAADRQTNRRHGRLSQAGATYRQSLTPNQQMLFDIEQRQSFPRSDADYRLLIGWKPSNLIPVVEGEMVKVVYGDTRQT